MDYIVEEMVGMNISNHLYGVLEDKGYTHDQIGKVLAESKDSENGVIVTEILEKIKENYDFDFGSDDTYIMNVVDEESEEWLRDNQEKFEKHIEGALNNA